MTYPNSLVLNADFSPLSYFPLSVVNWQDAIRGVMSGKYVTVEESEHVVRSPTSQFVLPSVIALTRYNAPARNVSFTRHNVFLRDEFKCQYCADGFDRSELTFEHVVPRARGGVTSWENIATACVDCNRKKADRMDMKPFRKPFMPTPHYMLNIGKKFPPKDLREDWISYLYWNTELEN